MERNPFDPIAMVTQDNFGNIMEVRLVARYMVKLELPDERVTCCEVTTTWSCGTYHPSAPPEEDCR